MTPARSLRPLVCGLFLLGAGQAQKMNLLTSFGGSDGDSVTSMAVGAAGDIYIAGSTSSRDLKAHNRPFSSNLYRVEEGGTRPVYTLPGDVYQISGNPEALFAGTRRGAFRSDDGGATGPE